MLRILLLCCGLFAEASEYIFSYRVTIANGLMLNEKYNFAPTMLSYSLLDVNPYKTCEIAHNANTEKEFLNAYKNEILECFFQWGVHLEDHSKIHNLQGESLTFLSIPPSRIRVEYASGIATIYALMQSKRMQGFSRTKE